jgi:hypothetical protein
MSDDWGPWIEHDGKGCPPHVVGQFAHLWFELVDDQDPHEAFVVVDAVIACCESWKGETYGWADGYIARWMGKSAPMRWITRYRIRKPLGLTILEGQLTNLPQPEAVPA